MTSNQAPPEPKVGFAFGRNWLRFAASVTPEQVKTATSDLRDLLGVTDLRGTTFLDAGCGSGIASLAALRLGATVTAFDRDPDAVRCTRQLLADHAPAGSRYSVLEGSALDEEFLRRLGPHDVVYSWGVLHHTGRMIHGLRATSGSVRRGGVLCIAIYNDAGFRSRAWATVKRLHSRLPAPAAHLLVWSVIVVVEGRLLVRDLLSGRPAAISARIGSRGRRRGMRWYRDWVDWVGGHPYEYARPEVIERHLDDLGFEVRDVIPASGTGCNEFVAIRQG